MGNAVFAIFYTDIANDVLTAGWAEVDIEIRGRDTVGVEEAFEDKAVSKGVDGCDFERVGE